jgi:hypothetical protein
MVASQHSLSGAARATAADSVSEEWVTPTTTAAKKNSIAPTEASVLLTSRVLVLTAHVSKLRLWRR